jgi:hypothetical protein
VSVATSSTGLVVNPQMLQTAEEKVVARRLREIFSLLSN